jgi:hypothetical protein
MELIMFHSANTYWIPTAYQTLDNRNTKMRKKNAQGWFGVGNSSENQQ